MITLNASGGSITFTFSGNSTYLNDGVITCPVNSLALIIDESDMVTFRKSASADIFVSANIAEFGMTKDELIAWYKENMVGSSGGGGGVTPEEFEAYSAATDSRIAEDEEVTAAGLNAINDRLSEDEEVTAAGLNAINDRLSEDEEVTAAGLNSLNEALSGKADTSAITTSVTSASTDAQVPSAKAVYDIVGNIETLLSQI